MYVYIHIEDIHVCNTLAYIHNIYIQIYLDIHMIQRLRPFLGFFTRLRADPSSACLVLHPQELLRGAVRPFKQPSKEILNEAWRPK